jgi:hypothetical protein
MTIGHFAMLMGFAMSAQWAFHRFDSSRGSSLLDQSHISLTHHRYFNWIWQHSRFKTTAAQRAGLADQAWTWRDLMTYPTII